MKTVMVLAGGTATAWSACNAIKKIGGAEARLLVCDINPPRLVHTSALADEFIQVPPIVSDGYYDYMLALMEEKGIDVLVPLIDWDIRAFPRDSGELIHKGIFSAAPPSDTFTALSDKRNLWRTLNRTGVPTPRIYKAEDVEDDGAYFVKPVIGFGSQNAEKLTGREIKSRDMTGLLIQELCLSDEITVDISCLPTAVRCVCRERIETKAGVCTKARVFYDRKIEEYISRIAKAVALPEANCAQFMKSADGRWLLTDFNLRQGGGSALSAAVGFTMAEAAAAQWLGMPEKAHVDIPSTERYVVRHYSELVTQ